MKRRQINDKESAVIIRNVPADVHRKLKAKAALEGKTMQGVILELIEKYIALQPQPR